MKPEKRKCRQTKIDLETYWQAQQIESALRDDGDGIIEELMTDSAVEWQDTEHDTPGHIPAEAKRILDQWMFDHRYYCYPSKVEKQQLSAQTKLSVQRISNWFVNSRRRSLPKLIESDGKNVSDFIITRKRNGKKAAGRSGGGNGAGDGAKAMPKKNKVVKKESPKVVTVFEPWHDLQPEPDAIEAEPETVDEVVAPVEPVTGYDEMTVHDAGGEEWQANHSECGKKRYTTGLIDDQTTNIKYLYILEETF